MGINAKQVNRDYEIDIKRVNRDCVLTEMLAEKSREVALLIQEVQMLQKENAELKQQLEAKEEKPNVS